MPIKTKLSQTQVLLLQWLRLWQKPSKLQTDPKTLAMPQSIPVAGFGQGLT